MNVKIFSLIRHALGALLDALLGRSVPMPSTVGPKIVSINPNGAMTADPPPLHWAPCHPTTVRRFKASMTCPYGHGLTLKGHSISTNGEVWPSVICPSAGCHFHEFIRLEGWDYPEQI